MQQQINHVSHVSFVYRRENIAAVKEQYSRAFGIDDWDGPVEVPGFGILQVLSVSAGIELLAPLYDEDNIFADHIRDKGEGVFAVIFGVADVREAARLARERGVGMKMDSEGTPAIIDGMTFLDGRPTHESWSSKLKTYQEVWLDPIGGVHTFLGQIEPR